MKKSLCLLLFLAASCTRPETKVASSQAGPAPALEKTNVLLISNGAAVVSRTGEAVLNTSPVRLIDGDPVTRWLSPPHNLQQSMVFSFPARVRVDKIGMATGSLIGAVTRKVEFSLSADGVTYTTAGTFAFAAKPGLQMHAIKPSDARYLKVTTLEADGAFANIFDLYTQGTLLESAKAGRIDGCWEINGAPALFATSGAQVQGSLSGRVLSLLDGGSDGRFFRLAWIRGQEFGLAALSVSPDGQHLSGMVWHEQAIMSDQFLASDWLGSRPAGKEETRCAPATQNDLVFRTYLDRFGYMPLYGLRFDDQGVLDTAASVGTLERVKGFLAAHPGMKARIVAHELRTGSPANDLRVTQKECATLRDALGAAGVNPDQVTFVAAGRDHPRREANTVLTRAMYSVIDLEVAR